MKLSLHVDLPCIECPAGHCSHANSADLELTAAEVQEGTPSAAIIHCWFGYTSPLWLVCIPIQSTTDHPPT